MKDGRFGHVQMGDHSVLVGAGELAKEEEEGQKESGLRW